ncbi:40-residue YVTN family beta-propeller repeat protein [Mizugakiibacter sediminis]|uniref:40-residue YVTN family beta-propeller repeat protein n=1 Tax=Mizugakiibacter sediminis TaxID=1475481 RepID=A0A0K8QNR8_9GAMM|nr:YncE family protein [Mizugakiibacter sediminis]GAP66062.1 40-residue YVTN family beta-propeller repeat protein [Mizugakiibacter sediminis]
MRAGARAITAAAIAAFAAAALAWVAPRAADGYRVLHRYRLGGEGGWDYLTLDAAGRRLYVSHGDRVVVMDADSDRVLGTIGGLSGVHGVALAPALRRGWISDGRGDAVRVFDTATLEVTATLADVGGNPDAIVYDAPSARVLTFNGRSRDVTAIDAAGGKIVGRLALSGKPEFAVGDGRGRIYVNIEDKGHLAVLDPLRLRLLAEWPLRDCVDPTGLALDPLHRRLFSVCRNRRMVVTDAADGHAVAALPIGDGPDGVAFDAARGLVYSSNGASGTLTVVHQDDADHYRVVAEVPTQPSARTLALDPVSGNVYLSAATVVPADGARLQAMVPGSFVVLVVGRPVAR